MLEVETEDMEEMFKECFLYAALYGVGLLAYTLKDGFKLVPLEDYPPAIKERMVNLEKYNGSTK